MATDSIPPELTAACQSVRPAGPGDTVAGVRPSFVAAPAGTAEASALLRAATALDLAVVPRGTGTRLHWGTPPARCDLVIEMTLMDRVIEHAAGDLVATVQAGVSLERLAKVLGQAGQRLALDPPALDGPRHEQPTPGRAAPDMRSGLDRVPVSGPSTGPLISRGTIGGVIAAGAAGPLRLRYGSPRDLLIGITVVRADGAVAKAGGKVVKNVAGYDLGKLFAGSRGTLGLITEATFRLHPVPSAVAYVTVECAVADDACQLLGAAMDSPLVPVAAEIAWPSAEAPVLLGFALEGDATAMAERSAELADLLAHAARRSDLAAVPADPRPARSPDRPRQRSAPEVSKDPPPWWGAGPAARSGGTVLQIAFWPGDLGLVLARLRAAAAAAGLDPAAGGSAAAGVLHVAVPSAADPDSVAAFVGGLRASIGHVSPAGDGHTPARASAVVLHAPAAVSALLDLFGPVPSLALMRAVKHRFDPDCRMAPGRFAGGI
jgi:glycolate oxidase FAD binding subunit